MNKAIIASALAVTFALAGASTAMADARPGYRQKPTVNQRHNQGSTYNRRPVANQRPTYNQRPVRRAVVRRPALRPFYISSAPSAAYLGRAITIRGNNLNRRMTLQIGRVSIAPSYSSPTMLRFVVPAHLGRGRYQMLLVGPRQTKRIGAIALRHAPRQRRFQGGWSYRVGMFFNVNG
jgi:hypothetical protein